MKRKSWLAAVTIASAMVATVVMTAKPVDAGTQGENKSRQLYAVVQVGDELRVIASSEVKELQGELAKEYQEAVKEYAEAKKAAARNKEPFHEPQPVKKTVKIIADSIATEEEAEKLRKKQEERLEKVRLAKLRYLVIRVGEEYKITTTLEFSKIKRELKRTHAEAMKSYAQRKKAARKEKREFDEQKPKATRVKVMAPPVKTEELAGAQLKKLQDKDKKKRDANAKRAEKKKAREKKKKGDDDGDDDGDGDGDGDDDGD